MKKFIKMLVPSILGSGLTIAVFLLTGFNRNHVPITHAGLDPAPVHKTIYTVKENGEFVPLDFTGVSKEVMNSVVHIKSTRRVQASNQFFFNQQNPFGDMFGDEFFRYFYGDPQPQKPDRSI